MGVGVYYKGICRVEENAAKSSAVKMVAAWRRDQRDSNEGKTAEQPNPSSDLDPSV